MTSDDKQTPPSKWRRWRRYLFAGLALTLLLLLGGALLAWLAPGLPILVREPAGDTAAIQTLENRLSAIERRLETLADDVAINAAKGHKVTPVASNKLWWIAETERYLTEAGERLDGGGVKAALPALKSAKQTLASVDVAAADAVKEALDGEIRLLNGYRNQNAARALATIDALLERFENDAAAKNGATSDRVAPEAETPASDAGPWTRFTDAVNSRVKQLVVTRKKSETESARLTRGLVTRSLLLARMAVLGNDDLSYRYAIVNAIQSLERNGESNTEVYKELQALHRLDVTDAPPRIGKALDKIRALAVKMNREATP